MALIAQRALNRRINRLINSLERLSSIQLFDECQQAWRAHLGEPGANFMACGGIETVDFGRFL